MKLKFKNFNFVELMWIYYIIALCHMQYMLNKIFQLDMSSVLDQHSIWFNWIPDGVDINAYISFIAPAMMASFLVLFPFLYKSLVRWLWLIKVFFIVNLYYTYANIHGNHLTVWVCLFLAIYPSNMTTQQNDSRRSAIFIRIIQILAIYGLSGFWKLARVIKAYGNENMAKGADFIRYSMAHEFVFNNSSSAISTWISGQELLCYLLYIMLFFGQLGSLVVIFCPRYYRIWGIVLIFFHIGTMVVNNIFFLWYTPTIILFLVLFSYDEKKTSSGFVLEG